MPKRMNEYLMLRRFTLKFSKNGLKIIGMNETVKKGGLIYSEDYKTIYGIDHDSNEFKGNIPNGVLKIGEDAFSCCDLDEIILPESVQEVGANLFCNSKNLIHVKLPSGLKNLSPFMFCGCSSLKRIEMPDEITEFTEGLFAECSSLEEIPFRAGIKVLPENVFSGCSSLKSLVIPGTVQKICKQAISDCKELQTIVLPEELNEIEDEAIEKCPELTKIRISDDNPTFFTDEEGTKLYRRKSDGSGTVIFECGKKVQSEVPNLNPIDETKNPSIIDYSSETDETNEPEIDLFSVGNKNVIINGDENKTEAENKNPPEKIDENKTQTEKPENADETENKPNSENGDNKKVSETEEKKEMSSDMEAKLAEIMTQEKQFDDGDFSIMSIPEASEEEIEAEKLAPSKEEEKEDFTPTIEIPKPVVHETPKENPESMEDKLADIMTQETANFSISDIPEASEADIEADRLVAEGDFAAGVESADSAVPEIPESEKNPEKESYADDEKSVMNNMIFESDKIEQINLIPDADEQKILFVFAEELAKGQFGKVFSKRLINCATRLAEIHKYTSIYLFYGIELDNEKFNSQFSRYMKDKSVVIACTAGTIGSVGDKIIQFAKMTGVPLEKDALDEQVRLARSPEASCIKLLIQDNLAE